MDNAPAERCRTRALLWSKLTDELCQLDGAPELWSLFSQHFNSNALGFEPVKLVDAWHALEYLAAAAPRQSTCSRVGRKRGRARSAVGRNGCSRSLYLEPLPPLVYIILLLRSIAVGAK